MILLDRCIKQGIQVVYLKILSINRKDKNNTLTNHKSLTLTFNRLKMECIALSDYIQANQETLTQSWNLQTLMNSEILHLKMI